MVLVCFSWVWKQSALLDGRQSLTELSTSQPYSITAVRTSSVATPIHAWFVRMYWPHSLFSMISVSVFALPSAYLCLYMFSWCWCGYRCQQYILLFSEVCMVCCLARLLGLTGILMVCPRTPKLTPSVWRWVEVYNAVISCEAQPVTLC